MEMADDKTQIMARNDEWMQRYTAGDIEGLWNSIYKKDGLLMPPGKDTLSGNDAIAFFQGLKSAGIAKIDLKPLDIAIKGDWATDRGLYTLVKDDGSKADNGKYLVVWEKIDEKWFYAIDIFNSNN